MNREIDKSPVLRAIRGATTVPRDEPGAIEEGTRVLLQEMLSRNQVDPDQLVSIVFTATPDLISAFPAAAARSLGIDDVPLLCAAEIAVPGAVPRCIRILLHLHTVRSRPELRHVYLEGATALRGDVDS